MIAFREIPSDTASQAALKGDTTFQRFLQIHKRGLIPWSIFLVMAMIFVMRMVVFHHDGEPEPSTSSQRLSTRLDHFLKSNEEVQPLWSYSILYDEDDDRLQEHGAVLSELYGKHAKFLWIEVGVMLFAPHLSMHKLFASPTMRAVLEEQSRMLSSHSKRLIVAIAKTLKTVYENRSGFSTLSEYTWYFTIEEDEKKPPFPRPFDFNRRRR